MEAIQIDELAEVANASPLVRKVLHLIIDDIENLKQGEPLLPELDLAEKHGVSRRTIRAAMKILHDEDIICRVKGKGTFPTQGEGSSLLFKKKTLKIGIVGVFHHMVNTSDFTQLINDGLITQAFNKHCDLVLSRTNNQDELLDTCKRLYSTMSVDALVLVSYVEQQVLEEIAEFKIPICLLDHYSESEHIDCVRVDSRQGSALAVEHLYNLGHRKIAYAFVDQFNSNPARVQGYLDSLKTFGLEQRDDWIIKRDVDTEGGESLAMKLLALTPDKRPTALLTFNTKVAREMIQAFKKVGLKVPQDLSIVSTGGTIEEENDDKAPRQKLTSICFDWKVLGHIAIQHVLARIEDPHIEPTNTFVSPSLEIGNTAAKLADK